MNYDGRLYDVSNTGWMINGGKSGYRRFDILLDFILVAEVYSLSSSDSRSRPWTYWVGGVIGLKMWPLGRVILDPPGVRLNGCD